MNTRKIFVCLLLMTALLFSLGLKGFKFGKEKDTEQTHYQKGNRFIREYKYYDAAREFEKAGQMGVPLLNNIMNNFKDVYEAQKRVAESPKDFEANLALAHVYHKRFNSFKATDSPLAEHYMPLTEEQYNTTAQIGGNQRFEPYKGLGDLYFSVKRWDAAAEAYKKLLEISANDHASRARLAECNFNMGQLQEAGNEAKRILSADPGCAKCFEILGQIEDRRQQTDMALQYYRKAIRYDPGLQLASRRVNEIEDARTPKGFLMVTYNKEGAAKESWGMSDVDDTSRSSVGVYGSSRSSSASARGSYDTTDYGSGSYEAEGEYNSDSAAMWGDMYSNYIACRPDDIEVFAYNKTNKRKYFLEDGVRSAIPEGSYVFYAAFTSRCDKQFGEPYKANQKTKYNRDFKIERGQSMNLEVQMQADMLPKNCAIKVVQKRDMFAP